MPAMPTILISAVPADEKIAGSLERALSARGFAIRRAPAMAAPAAGSSDSPPVDGRHSSTAHAAYAALLLVLSPGAAAAETTLRAYHHALGHGAAILPVLARPTPNLPAELHDLQWIDYSASAERGWSSLLVALEALGLLPKPTDDPARFDWELALARAQQGLTPPTWHVYRPLLSYYARASLRLRGLLILLLLLGGPFFYLVAELLARALSGRLEPLSGVIAWVLVGAACVFLGWRFVRLHGQQRQSRLRPELFVLTPEGFVLRRFSGTTVCQFADTATVNSIASPRRVATTLVVTPRDGRPAYSAALDLRFGVPSVIAEQVSAAFAAYWRRYADAPQAPHEPAPPSLFISYAHTNSWYADVLERNLNARGLSVWMDRSRLVGGQEWPAALQQAIESCAALLVVLTPEALDSATVRREYEYAIQLGKPVLPLLYRPTASLPEALRARGVIDCTSPDGSLRGEGVLTLALDRLGIRPPSPPGMPRMDPVLAMARGDAKQMPPGWHVYHSTVPRPARWFLLPFLTALAIVYLVGAVGVVYDLVFRIGLSNTEGEAFGMFASLIAIALLFAWVLVTAVRLVRRPPSSMTVLTPEGVAMRYYDVIYAYQYCEIAGVAVKGSQRGVVMEFMPRGGQQPMKIVFLRSDAPPAVIAQQIQADYARYARAYLAATAGAPASVAR